MADRSITITVGLKDLATKGLRAIRKSFGALTKIIGGTTKQVTKLTAALSAVTLGAFAGIGGLFTQGIKSAAGFEKQLDIVAAKSGATTEQLEQLREAALKAGRETKFTATESAEALTVLAQAGVNTADSIQILPDLLALATAENLSLADSASFLTATMAQFGLPAEQSTRIVDALSKGANLATTTVSQLGRGLSFAGSTADSAGLSLEQTVAALDILAKNALAGERGGTGLRGVLAQLSDPASKARKELAALGDTSGTLVGAIDAVSGAGIKGEKAILAFGLEAGPAFRALASEGVEALNEYNQQINDAAGFTDKTAKAVGDNLEGALTRLGSAADGINQTLFLPVLDILKKDVDELAQEINAFSEKGGLDGFRDVIRSVFRQATRAIRAFLLETDFRSVATRVSDFVNNFTKGFNIVSATIQTFSNAFTIFIRGAVAGVTLLLKPLAAGIRGIASSLEFFGLISEQSKQKVADLTQVINDLHENAAAGVQQDFKDIGAAWESANKSFSNTAGAQKAVSAEKALTESAKGAAAAQKSAEDSYKSRAATQARLAKDIENTENELLQLQRQAQTAAEKTASVQSRLAAQQFQNQTAQIDLRRQSADGFVRQFQIQSEARARLAEAEKQTKAAIEATTEAERQAAIEAAQRNIDRADQLEDQVEGEFQRKKLLEDIGKAREELIKSEIADEEAVAEAREEKIEALKEELKTLNESAKTLEIEADTDDATKKLDGIKEQLDELSKGVTVPVRQEGRLNTGGAVPSRFAVGGRVTGPGGIDRVPAWLTAGEWVIQKPAVDFYGRGLMNALNQMKLPRSAIANFSAPNVINFPAVPGRQRFQTGGEVGPENVQVIRLEGFGRKATVRTPRDEVRDLNAILAGLARGQQA